MAQARGASRLSRLRLLALALAIPLAAVAALVATVALTRHPVSRPAPLSVATPSPHATPTLFPAVFTAADDFTLAAPQAFGALVTPRVGLPDSVKLDISVGVEPVGLPADLPVWRLSAVPLDPRRIADRFGIAAGESSSTENGMTSWRAGLGVDPTDTVVVWIPIGVPAPSLGGDPRDSESAARLAAGWLARSGLLPPTGDPPVVDQTSAGDSASLPEWTVTWHRVAPAYPGLPIDDVVARVSGDGTLKQLDLSHPRVSGGSLYHLRPWQDALRDARANRWFQLCCEPIPDSTTGTVHISVTVSIEYALADTPQGRFAIPMYAFTEAPGYQPGLVPAIAP